MRHGGMAFRGGERHFKAGPAIGLDTALDCMRRCQESVVCHPTRVVFDLRGTRTLPTAELGIMLLIRGGCHLDQPRFLVPFDHPDVARVLYPARFQELFNMVGYSPMTLHTVPGETQ